MVAVGPGDENAEAVHVVVSPPPHPSPWRIADLALSEIALNTEVRSAGIAGRAHQVLQSAAPDAVSCVRRPAVLPLSALHLPDHHAVHVLLLE